MAVVKNTAYPDRFRPYPRVGFPYSVAELRKMGFKGKQYDYLRRLATRDVVTLLDDFNTKAIDTTTRWTLANGGGSGALSFVVNLQANGAVRATTGTANGATASASLIGPLIYPGELNVGVEFRFKMVTANTGVKLELGLIDAVPGSNGGGVNNMDTPTATMGDGALVAIDLGATANKWNLVTNGSATNQAVTRTVSTTGLAAAGTYQTVRVQTFNHEDSAVDAVSVAAWIDGQLIGFNDDASTVGTGAIKGSVLLAPWVYIVAQNATSTSLDLDYVHIWHDRAA